MPNARGFLPVVISMLRHGSSGQGLIFAGREDRLTRQSKSGSMLLSSWTHVAQIPIGKPAHQTKILLTRFTDYYDFPLEASKYLVPQAVDRHRPPTGPGRNKSAACSAKHRGVGASCGFGAVPRRCGSATSANFLRLRAHHHGREAVRCSR